MEILVYIANILYVTAYLVRDLLHLRILTIIAAGCLAAYFYNQAEPMMTVVMWNLFFIALNAWQLARIVKERPKRVTASTQSSRSHPDQEAIAAST
jgi:hypothetical protein